MALLDALNTARDLGRLQDIGAVLMRHGMGDIVRRLGLASALERAGQAVHWKAVQGIAKPPEVRLRIALEELGPTFVKLGQILAGRSDLVPPAWAEELAKLREQVATEEPEVIRRQLVEDLGAAPEEVFANFEPTPLAAASIAQVHRATLTDGSQVCLKIRRPGIAEVVEADLSLLTRLAELAEEGLPELARFQPRSLVREFARSLRAELDLRIEAKNTERMRRNLASATDIVVPRVHGRWTTERLCVLEFLEGPSIGDWIEEAREDGSAGSTGAQGPRFARLGAQAVLHTIFNDGFFHADPHPGNILVLPDGRLGLLDYGMVGSLSESRRLEFLNLLLALVSRDVESAVRVLEDWTSVESDANLLAQDCRAFLDRYESLPLGELDMTELLTDLSRLLRENHILLPDDVALLLKVFLTLDSLGRALDPSFVMATLVEPFARKAWREEHSPMATARRAARELHSIATVLPRDLRRLLQSARRGQLKMHHDVEQLAELGSRIDRSANRLTMGFVTAALIVGTSIALTVPGGPQVLGMPLFGFLGFTSSMAAGVWLLWSILRSGRS